MVKRLTTLCVLVVLALPASASADGHFGRLFPKLDPFTEPTNQQLADLATSMLDPGDEANDNPAVPSIITYGGQFLDHDLTLDLQPTPTGPVDPTTLENFRTPRLDLDSVYGEGRDDSPELYDGRRLKVDESNAFGVRDLPRNADGSAIVGDARNDENRIIGQLHLAFLLAHNRLIDEGKSFKSARRTLRRHWQRIIVDEYLPAVAGQDTVDRFLHCRRHGCHVHDDLFTNPGPRRDRVTPVEFSVASFRFGHSEVRNFYEISEESGAFPVFSLDPTETDLRGGSPLTEQLQIEWGNFAAELTEPDDADGINLTRHIDTLISESLFKLPIPGAEAEGSNVLPFRSFVRAKRYGLPSYEDVAEAMDVHPVHLDLGPGFSEGTPLLFGIWAESEQREDGLLLGPVGARINTEVILTFLDRSADSYFHKRHFKLDKEIAGRDGRMTFSDLLVFSGVAEFPDEEE